MKITTEQDGGYWYILNRGRVIGQYNDFLAYQTGLRIMGRLTAQLQRPETFCDCKPKQEGLR